MYMGQYKWVYMGVDRGRYVELTSLFTFIMILQFWGPVKGGGLRGSPNLKNHDKNDRQLYAFLSPPRPAVYESFRGVNSVLLKPLTKVWFQTAGKYWPLIFTIIEKCI